MMKTMLVLPLEGWKRPAICHHITWLKTVHRHLTWLWLRTAHFGGCWQRLALCISVAEANSNDDYETYVSAAKFNDRFQLGSVPGPSSRAFIPRTAYWSCIPLSKTFWLALVRVDSGDVGTWVLWGSASSSGHAGPCNAQAVATNND